MVQPTTLRTIINELVRRQLLSPEATEQMSKTQIIFSEKLSTPWFVNALIGISAWLAVIPLLVFLFLIQLINTATSTIGVGILFISGTVFLKHFYKEDTFFSAQFALALNLTGQLLFIGGLWAQTDSIVAALAANILELFLFNFYHSNIIRFTAVLIFIASLIVLLYEWHLYQGIHVVILAAAAGSIWCWLRESQHQLNEIMVELYLPLGYGLVTALFILLLPSVLIGIIPNISITWSFSTLGLIMLLLGLESILLHNHNLFLVSLNNIILLGGTFLIGLLFYQAPGIVATVIVMILGFQRSNLVLMGGATLFFTVFLVAYYYHLEFTLLMKSITLVSSGFALLGLRWILKQLPQGE